MRSFNAVCACLILAAASLSVTGCDPVCGDGLCEVEEEGRCSADCYCGDGLCARNENSDTCPADCGRNPVTQVCGNGVCEGTETFSSCPGDCDPPVCDRDGRCDPGENNSNCPGDCPPEWDCFCGDGYCDLTCENASTCYDDCGWCGDGLCTWPEDSYDCAYDCGCPWDFPFACGGECWTCNNSSDYASCCGGVFVTCGYYYPYYCPIDGLCYTYPCSGWEYYCDYIGYDC